MLNSFDKVYKKIKRKFYTKEPVYDVPEINIKRADLLEISRKEKLQNIQRESI